MRWLAVLRSGVYLLGCVAADAIAVMFCRCILQHDPAWRQMPIESAITNHAKQLPNFPSKLIMAWRGAQQVLD